MYRLKIFPTKSSPIHSPDGPYIDRAFLNHEIYGYFYKYKIEIAGVYQTNGSMYAVTADFREVYKIEVADETILPTKEFLDSLIGKDSLTANKMCDHEGFIPRTVCNDGRYYGVTHDMRLNRINFEIEKDIVTKVTTG